MSDIIVYASFQLSLAFGGIVGFQWVGSSVKKPFAEVVAFGLTLCAGLMVAALGILLGEIQLEGAMPTTFALCFYAVMCVFLTATPRLAWNLLSGHAFVLGFLFRVTFYTAIASYLFTQMEEMKPFAFPLAVYEFLLSLIFYTILWVHRSFRRKPGWAVWLATLAFSPFIAAMLEAINATLAAAPLEFLEIYASATLNELRTVPPWNALIGGFVYVIVVGLFAWRFSKNVPPEGLLLQGGNEDHSESDTAA